ncbi:MAG: [FeFe] hydrogenase H-cluster radical SAM maturase HydE, partial [Endomicrobiales bacterium]
AHTQALYDFADSVRRESLGDGIVLRGIVEFSSFCRNTCHYCGLNRNNTRLKRYRLSREELLKSAEHVASCGVKTVVLQSGEEDDLDPSWLAEAVAAIKEKTGMAVTLSAGERDREDYRLWKEAGADRYLLKIESSDKALYESFHPSMSFENRVRCLDDLRELGYQVGSGIIVGLRNQTLETLARDLLFFKERDLDMIGIGPFIPHRETLLKGDAPGSVQLTLKMVALTRIVTRNAHLPATTALGSIGGEDYRVEGLKCGANVLMPNFTPAPYRKQYEIYPGKRCVDEPAGACAFCMESMALSIGRHIDHSRGDSMRAVVSGKLTATAGSPSL